MYVTLKKSTQQNELQSYQQKIRKSIKNISKSTGTRIYQNKNVLYNNDLRIQYNKYKKINKYPSVQLKPVVQMYEPQESPFEQNTVIEWKNEGEKNEFWDTVDKGLILAVEQLEKVIAQQENKCLKKYALEVKGILAYDKLKIYPMTNAGIYGKSSYFVNEISLNVNLLKRKDLEMAKTLIHEAFHIIGGCWRIDPISGHHDYDANLDTPCNLKDIDEIYSEIQDRNLENIRADAFAQYVMLFRNSLCFCDKMIDLKNPRRKNHGSRRKVNRKGKSTNNC